ncbi:MAG: CAP domain-containing protein [Planctomycetota bacterium]
MIQRALLLSLFALATTAMVAAQSEEAQFNQRQAKALNAYAKKAFDKGFPRIAKVVWLKTIKLYDPDNEDAWTALGYVKNGSSWVLDTRRPYPTKDTGKGSDGKPLQSQYRSLEKKLAGQHKSMAKKYEKAGRRDRAMHHWKMVLRFLKEDGDASKALSHQEVGGLSGTDLEKTLYERSKMIEKAVEEQAGVEYETERVEGVDCKPVQQAQVPYITVRSEHFTLHGDEEEEANLHDALQWAERALRVCKVAFPWQYADGKWPLDWAFFTAKESYQQILRANQVPDLEWKLENSSASTIAGVRVGSTSGRQVLLDACVRNVAGIYSGFGATAYNEGIGHTFVGMMFNNNRLFAVDLKKQQGTTASEEDREFQSPDFDVWKNLSLEMAWKSTGGVPANTLPFCEASNFTNEQRIKSWSFTDYMMRRDPELLRKMDQIAQEMKKRGAKQPGEFEAKFAEVADGVTIPQLDKEWEDFWTEASPVLKSIRDNTPPVSAISKDVDKWLAAFNERRKEHRRAPVTWSATFSARCKDHADYLAANKGERGPGAEHVQKVELGGSYSGRLFAQMAVVETGVKASKADKVFDEWIYKPGYRDLFINHTLLSIGMYAEGNILVINATSGIGDPKDPQAGFDCYPPRNDTNLIFEREVDVSILGPEAEELLKKHGREGNKQIGFPLTMHFGSSGGIDLRSTLQCTVTDKEGNAVEGVTVFDDGEVRTTSAPGMATFWPLDPLPKGKIHFTWSWSRKGQSGNARGAFTAK